MSMCFTGARGFSGSCFFCAVVPCELVSAGATGLAEVAGATGLAEVAGATGLAEVAGATGLAEVAGATGLAEVAGATGLAEVATALPPLLSFSPAGASCPAEQAGINRQFKATTQDVRQNAISGAFAGQDQ